MLTTNGRAESFATVKSACPSMSSTARSLAVNLSDIAAMGGRPHLALITLTLPEDFYVEDAQELYRGLRAAAIKYGATIGGGDIVRSPVFSAVTVRQSRAIRIGSKSSGSRSVAGPAPGAEWESGGVGEWEYALSDASPALPFAHSPTPLRQSAQH